jgi:hypothetical protein
MCFLSGTNRILKIVLTKFTLRELKSQVSFSELFVMSGYRMRNLVNIAVKISVNSA